MRQSLTFLIRYRYLIAYCIVPSIIVNLPLIAVVVLHWPITKNWSLLGHYPGQFIPFLFPIFPIAAYFTSRAGWTIIRTLRSAERDIESVRAEDPDQAKKMADDLKYVWPWYLRPSAVVIIGALLLGVLAGIASHQADDTAVYQLQRCQAKKVIKDIDYVLSAMELTPEKIRPIAWEYVRNTVARDVRSMPANPRMDSAWDEDVKRDVDGLAQKASEAFKTLHNPNTGQSQPTPGYRSRWITALDFIELGAVVFVTLHLFIWIWTLTYIRIFRNRDSISLRPEFRDAAIDAAMALFLFTLWVPARMFTVQEMRLIDQQYGDIGGPYLVIAVVFVAAIFLAIVITQNENRMRWLQRILTVSPVIISAVLAYADPMFVRRLLGPSADIWAFAYAAAVLAILLAAIYGVLKMAVVPSDGDR